MSLKSVQKKAFSASASKMCRNARDPWRFVSQHNAVVKPFITADSSVERCCSKQWGGAALPDPPSTFEF